MRVDHHTGLELIAAFFVLLGFAMSLGGFANLISDKGIYYILLAVLGSMTFIAALLLYLRLNSARIALSVLGVVDLGFWLSSVNHASKLYAEEKSVWAFQELLQSLMFDAAVIILIIVCIVYLQLPKTKALFHHGQQGNS